MRILQRKGFTLIELLVVITIIGILATGGTAVYTTQIQKARDTTRIKDANALQNGLEQVFGDLSVFPEGVSYTTASDSKCNANPADNTSSTIMCVKTMGYMTNLPKDPKSGQPASDSGLGYLYAVSHKDGVLQQTYEVSIGFENSGNKTGKAAADG
jgi:general secretion pathway protein G